MLPKLSRRAWNNVLIFAVLLLMFLLYGTPQRLVDLPHRNTTLLGEQQLLSLEFSVARISRAPQGWQLTPAHSELQPLVERTIAIWQQQLLVDGERSVQPVPEPLTQAQLVLAGQGEPLIWVLSLSDQQFYLSPSHRRLYYPVSAAEAELLFPAEFR